MKRLGAYLYGDLPPPPADMLPRQPDLFGCQVIDFQASIELAVDRLYAEHVRERAFRRACEARS